MSVGGGGHANKLRGSPGVHEGPLDEPQASVGGIRQGLVLILKLSSLKCTNIVEKQYRERKKNANFKFGPGGNFKVLFDWIVLE